jgi:hypothetical protein
LTKGDFERFLRDLIELFGRTEDEDVAEVEVNFSRVVGGRREEG